MGSIVILTDRHMCDNPRVWKEANYLCQTGFKVVVLTSWFDSSKLKKDRLLLDPRIEYVPYLNQIPNETRLISRSLYRGRSFFARLLKRFLNVETIWLISYSPRQLFRKALEYPADLYLAHVETGLYAGVKLLITGSKVAFDFEDWYSEDYLVRERPVKLLRSLEKIALEKGAFAYCPSQSMANSLAVLYPQHHRIEAIYNGFSSKESICQNEIPKVKRSIVWFSQTIGPGRGLESVIKSLALISNKVILILIGNCDPSYKESLMRLFPASKGHELQILPPVDHSRLTAEIARFSIGLAIEQKYPRSRNETITNKILQYLQAGLQVLASDTNGQREVASYFPGTVKVVDLNDESQVAIEIEKLLKRDEVVLVNNLRIFDEIFSFEAQQKKLFNLIQTELHGQA